MARQRCSPPGGDGQRSPAEEEQKENNDEAYDGSNGLDGMSAQGNCEGLHVRGNGGGVQGGQQCERDGDGLGQHGRNVRQNVGPPPPDWSRNNLDLTTANLVPKRGTISGAEIEKS